MIPSKDYEKTSPDGRSGNNIGLEIAGFYGDNAVFQHGKVTVLRGRSQPEKKIELTVAGRHLAIFSNKRGEFTFRIPPMAPCSGLQMTVACGAEKIVFENIAFGNVYLAGGQSNMEFVMKSALPDESSLDESVFEKIRLFKLPPNTYYGPASAPEGNWIQADRESLSNFSAVGGFFAAALVQKTQIPVGIICASLGGVNIESFISEYSLLNSSVYAEETARYEANTASLDLECDNFPGDAMLKLNRAIHTLFPQEPDDGGVGSGFCAADYDDSNWDSMFLPDSWTQAGHNHAGIFYFRRTIILPEGAAKHRFTLHLGMVDKYDRTFINGVEIGSTGDAYTLESWNVLRVYEVPENNLHDGENTIAVRVLSLYSTNADGGMIGPAEDMYLESEDGSIHIDITGQWRFKETFDAGTEGMTCMRHFGQGGPNSFHGFFDNMIRPIEMTALAGVLWYQGEANTICSAGNYREMLELMIADWRRNFLDSKLHFYIIQLPDFQPKRKFAPYGTWPRLREAQLEAARNTDSTLITTIGFGEVNEIHPRNKKEIAEQIANYEYARLGGNTVKLPGLQSISARGRNLLLKFDQELDPDSPTAAFVIAGSDMIAHQAAARFIAPDTIELTASAVDKPFAVWYAWAENPRGFGLKTISGIAIPPFRAALDNSKPIGKNLLLL